MKFFTNKSVWSKIIIVLIFVLIFEFIVCKPSLGAGDALIEFGGKLMSPIMSFFVTVGDGIITLMQSNLMGTESSIIEISADNPWGWLSWLLSIVLVVAIAVAVVCSGGVALVAVGTAIVAFLGKAGLSALGKGVVTAKDEENGKEGEQFFASYTVDSAPTTLHLPTFILTPEEIFKGNILLFNVDFFGEPITPAVAYKGKTNKDGKYVNYDESGKEVVVDTEEEAAEVVAYYYYVKTPSGEIESGTGKIREDEERGEIIKTSNQNIAGDLQGVISQWYVAIRNIALVAMMIVLIYIGIRILLSSLASDKAKYKQMLQDWFIGLFLLFFMHYIMYFSIVVVNKVTDVVSSAVNSKGYQISLEFKDNDNSGDVGKNLKDKIDDNEELKQYLCDVNGNPDENGDYFIYPTNLMGALRLRTELEQWGGSYIGLGICYLILVMFTVFFIFTYLRRVLYMAFLTIIAPLVALTYPIDKLNDGSAQGFQKWLKEYIFNLLIQPVHLLLYFILISSAFTLSGANVIYSLVAIGFMIPAEKLLRSFFGFEKASTPGALAGVGGAALVMTGLQKLSSKGGKSSSTKSLPATPDKKPREKVPKDDDDSKQKDSSTPRSSGNGSGGSSSGGAGGVFGGVKGIASKALKGAGNLAKRAGKRTLKLAKRAPGKIARATGREALKLAKAAPGKAIRFTGKSMGAMGMGMVGLAAGIATGDPKSALGYGTGAGMVGKSLGGRFTQNGTAQLDNAIASSGPVVWLEDKLSEENARQRAEEKEMQRMQLESEVNEFLKSENYSEEQLVAFWKKDGIGRTCIKKGIKDSIDIATIERQVNERKLDISESIDACKAFRKNIDADKYEENLKKKLEKRGMIDAEKEARNARLNLDNFKDVRENIRKKRENNK